MSANYIKAEDLEWRCFKCNQPLTVGSALVDYLGNELTTDLPMCPSCSMVLISEQLAVGKVAEVEKLLEDK
jgi:hypothetical protein